MEENLNDLESGLSKMDTRTYHDFTTDKKSVDNVFLQGVKKSEIHVINYSEENVYI